MNFVNLGNIVLTPIKNKDGSSFKVLCVYFKILEILRVVIFMVSPCTLIIHYKDEQYMDILHSKN